MCLRNWRFFSVITVLILMTVVATIAIPVRPALAAAGIWHLQTVDPIKSGAHP